MQPTDIRNPDYFHKVVDCQWACPAHTPVPEYIRLIAAGRYDAAFLVNSDSNVYPGTLGRTGDRPAGRLRPIPLPRLSRLSRTWAKLPLETIHDPDGRPGPIRGEAQY